MDNFNNTFKLLDSLIAKLEANTGGEKLEEVKKAPMKAEKPITKNIKEIGSDQKKGKK